MIQDPLKKQVSVGLFQDPLIKQENHRLIQDPLIEEGSCQLAVQDDDGTVYLGGS
ncbi:MAG TPA: hypothetical protein PKA29_02300 [Candidatus Saccharibacteria bacterium]|nr:hypothetical protein [Candidatus Saccharibacteria bacterium]